MANDTKTWKLLTEQGLIIPYLSISTCASLLLFTSKATSEIVQKSSMIGKLLCEKRYPSSRLLIIGDYWLYLRGYPTGDYGRQFDDFNLLLIHGDSIGKAVELSWDAGYKPTRTTLIHSIV
jgi:hypothetical protein